MGYLDPEAPLAAAYRETARSIRREQNRDAYIDARYGEAIGALAGNPMARTTAYWNVRPVAPLMADLVAWVNDTADDPDTTLGRALADPMAAKALRESYALARAEAQANEYERNGGSWLEV